MFGPFRRRQPSQEASDAATTVEHEASPESVSKPAASTAPVPATGSTDERALEDRPLEERIVEALQTIYDPEIPVNIYELGLIYDVAIPEGDDGRVGIKMTLTSPHCPVAESLPGDVKRRVEAVEGVEGVDVEVVWDPAWNPEMMSEAAKLELGFF